MEQTIQPTVLAVDELTISSTANAGVETQEFEFTSDLAIELPVDIDPKKFFDYLVRVMIAHTEVYGGSMGGETKWHPYEVNDHE